MPLASPSRKRNITVSLPEETIRLARVHAARRSKSLSGFLVEQIHELAEEERGYEEDRQVALALMKAGFPMGGEPMLDRESLHER